MLNSWILFGPFFLSAPYEPASSCPLLPFLYPHPAPVDSPVGEEWSPWSVCSATCGEGWQSRTRFCVSASYSTQCSGPLREQRPCNNTAVCPGKRSPPRPLQYHQPLFSWNSNAKYPHSNCPAEAPSPWAPVLSKIVMGLSRAKHDIYQQCQTFSQWHDDRRLPLHPLFFLPLPLSTPSLPVSSFLKEVHIRAYPHLNTSGIYINMQSGPRTATHIWNISQHKHSHASYY